MARRGSGNDTEDLDLVPFMNMVVILIPLLLLSVVFLKVGVINITSPKLSVGKKSEPKKKKDEEKPLNLTVAISSSGFEIAATGAKLPAKQGCPSDGPTICLRDDSIDVESKVKQARQSLKDGSKEQGLEAMQEAESAYNWMELYNQLSEVKKEYPEETVVKISGSPSIPYAFVIKTMDTVRHQLEEESYDSREKFWKAKPKTEKKKGSEIAKPLFNDPVLSIAR